MGTLATPCTENLQDKMGSNNGKPVLREEDIAALSKSSGLDEAQVRENFDAFVAEYPNGKITRKYFGEIMSKVLPKEDASKMEKHFFRLYDANNDGFIDFTEFMLIFFIMSDGVPEEVLTNIFRVFDVNSDGTITQKEMTKLVKDMYGLLLKNPNPQILKDPNLPARNLIAKTAFAEMDKDQDGKVTTAEFIEACMGDEGFSKMLASNVIDIYDLFVEDE